MLNRNVTRVVLNASEITKGLVSPNGSGTTAVTLASDAMYIGYDGPFAGRFLQLKITNNVVAEMVVEYWDGSAWVAVDDFIDQTSVGGVTLAQDGFISWVNKGDWEKRAIGGVDLDIELYWVRVTVTADIKAQTSFSAILNLFCDDALLGSYFPELINDAAYLPTGKNNFLDQYVAAKNMVILRLKQRKAINFEWQVIDPNDVAIAATYAAAMIILQPIATSDATKELLAIAKAGFDDEISKVTFAIDEDEDGVISEPEKVQTSSVFIVRR